MKYGTAIRKETGILSRPARALWIEIIARAFLKLNEIVEAREGLVD